jgi:hypothetical protein
VHTGKEAHRAASLLGADAFAIGNDIVFRDGGYQPQARTGRQLLAHELGHVVQQRTIGARLQLRVGGDVSRISITPAWAADLTPDELTQQLEIVRQLISKLSEGSTDRMGAMENLGVLERDAYRRQGTAGPSPSAVTPARLGASAAGSATTQSAGQDFVPRPPGLPLAQGFVLQPVVGSQATTLAASLPEGRMVTLPSGDKSGASGDLPLSTVAVGGSGAYLSVNAGVNAGLRSGGFAAAGENAIGVVAIPRWFTPGNLLPETANAWGHTAVYARVGGRIQVVRGFTVADVGDTIFNASAIRSGMRPTAGMFAEDAALFTNTSAMSLEYPVAAEVAESLIKGLPPPGPAGMPYFAQPAVKCIGTNCVLWAVEQAEQQLGGRIGPAVEGGVSPITSAVGKGGADIAGTASQGKLYEFMGDVAAGERQAAGVPGSIGEAVAGGMPRGLTYLKWGGRVFLVASIVLVPVEVAMAPKGKRVRTAVGASSAFLGGLAGGALAGLACGPGAPVCSVVLGLGLGIAYAFTARSIAEDVYDAIDNQ